EREVLVHPHLAPPDPLGVRVAAAERTRAVNLPHAITPLLARDGHERRGRPRAAGLFVQTPAAEMIRQAEYAGTDAFGHPRAGHEPADPRPHLDQISRADALFLRVDRRNPQRIRVGDLVKPFHRGPRVNERRKPEIRQEIELALIAPQVAPVHVARNVTWDRVLGPSPLRKRRRIELEFARGRVEALAWNAVGDDTRRHAVAQN